MSGPDNAPVRWEECSWQEIAEIIGSGIDMAILPVGATEQHGRHLPTGVDSFCAEAVALGASARTGIPVLPVLSYGCSLGHSHKWPGTLSLRPETLAKIVLELAEWLNQAGIKRLLILNGHVTNFAPLRCALENIRHDITGMRIALRSVWELSDDIQSAYEYDGGTNWHANDAETSLMLHMRPGLVDMAQAKDEPDRSHRCFFSYTVDKESHDGVVGKPSQADAEFGRRLLDACVSALAARLDTALTEKSPLEEWTHEPFTASRPPLF